MAAPKRPPKCSECGAELQLGPARCPLCGFEPDEEATDRPVVYDRDRYQAAIRDLQDELKRLRDDGAEAV